MPPQGIIVSKLGLQVVATEEHVAGLLCLKISAPREQEGRTRYALFPAGRTPTLLSQPILSSLPLASKQSHQTNLARSLLGLSNTTYPPRSPTPTHPRTSAPRLEVSTDGQVYILLDGGRRSPSTRLSDSHDGARSEWLVTMNVQVDIQDAGDRSMVTIPLPKCLDNCIRFQIASADPQEGEVSVSTEPKLLPVPPSTFSPLPPQSRVRKGVDRRELGRGEGEWLDVGESSSSSSSGGVEENGEWLEGRFQSTDAFRLEWSHGSSSSSSAVLRITPQWDERISSIHVNFDSTIISHSDAVPLDAVIPDGWGWRNLTISGPGVLGWECLDIPSVSLIPVATHNTITPRRNDAEIDDSFSTVRGKRGRTSPLIHSNSPKARPVHSSVSLMKQTFPDAPSMDFSFEMHSEDSMHVSQPTPRPTTPFTPGRQTPPRQEPAAARTITFDRPVSARCFRLSLDPAADHHAVTFDGTLVALPHHLVCPDMPVDTPYITLHDESDHGCEVHYPHPANVCEDEMDGDGIGSFVWTDEGGGTIPARTKPLAHGATVVVSKNMCGLITMAVSLDWTGGGEMKLVLPHTQTARLVRAVLGGVTVPRIYRRIGDDTELRVGSGIPQTGSLDLVVEVDWAEEKIYLPRFEGSDATVRVELRGSGWEGVKTNLKRISPNTYSHDVSLSEPYIAPRSRAPATSRGYRGLLSWSTLINLFIVWLLVSMAQQVQRLRNEVAFVAEEARDLRLYGVPHTTTIEVPSACPSLDPTATSAVSAPTTSSSQGQRDALVGDGALQVARDDHAVSTSLGRVVFGRSAWDKWAHHPTLRSLGRSLGWVWQAVVWLVIPT